ncbi:hypothetical protein ABBQ38_003439 [Trebouxia sp. C0009 RCD-2024]
MALFADMISEVQEHARSLRRFLAPAVQENTPGYGRDYRRKLWLIHYEHADQPRYPESLTVTPNTLLLLYMFVKTVRVQGVTHLGSGTKTLLAAICLPFLKPGGFPSPKFGLCPAVVWEQRQWYRLLTTAFLHVDIDHALSNATSLVISANYLEGSLRRSHFVALTASLGLTSHSLYVLLSRLEYRWFGSWRAYFQDSIVGASGLCFALQVVTDHMRGGRVTVMGISGLDIPAKFSCWATLAVTQLLVPKASLTGHLCGIVAGLIHVYIPKAVREVGWQLGRRRRDGRRPSWQAQPQATRAALEQQVEFAGRRWPDLAVHAACLCAALLARALLSRSKNR